MYLYNNYVILYNYMSVLVFYGFYLLASLAFRHLPAQIIDDNIETNWSLLISWLLWLYSGFFRSQNDLCVCVCSYSF
jgi:hypothetical protein